jgi:hypothetical protein
MKGDLKVAGFGVNIMHGVNIPWWVIASTSRSGSRGSENKTRTMSLTPRVRKFGQEKSRADKHVKPQAFELA